MTIAVPLAATFRPSGYRSSLVEGPNSVGRHGPPVQRSYTAAWVLPLVRTNESQYAFPAASAPSTGAVPSNGRKIGSLTSGAPNGSAIVATATGTVIATAATATTKIRRSARMRAILSARASPGQVRQLGL